MENGKHLKNVIRPNSENYFCMRNEGNKIYKYKLNRLNHELAQTLFLTSLQSNGKISLYTIVRKSLLKTKRMSTQPQIRPI